ncbi:phosphoserine phosphatase [Aliiroseovarius crassostreae]|uniref:Phosphoserine phosphatase n=1 Tax=Aliiroseovarius crassostreae TaxID=154981 RepID=A0A0P7JNT8_9RHOB|nr:phosphoserine phosphatase SerB [Aliiroseovarius crassostreae]KPN62853.1 phosphoserine phosphatase [Aliiroseovarius crassostreae]SFU72050.1 phosphoserine phosphatase [Aliiroseovarius crassostreae]
MTRFLMIPGENGASAANFADFVSHVGATAGPATSSSTHIFDTSPTAGEPVGERARLREMAARQGMDICFLRGNPFKHQLLVADMEATIILDEMLDLLAEERGQGTEVAAITARAMAGELDFAQSLTERTRLLAGTPLAQLEALCQRIRLAPGARALVQTMRTAGARTVLVTGGYGIFAQEVARLCGFDHVVANNPVIEGGVMTGALELPICSAETKREVLLAECAALGIGPEIACCIGDGANDMLMLRACGLPVSYRGKPVVQEIVDLNITQGDLTAALFAQGFTAEEIERR